MQREARARISNRVSDVGSDTIKLIGAKIDQWVALNTDSTIVQFRRTGTGILFDKNEANILEYIALPLLSFEKKENKNKKFVNKSLDNALSKNSVSTYSYELEALKAAEPESDYLSKSELENKIREKRKLMEGAAKALDFIIAAKLRDEIKNYQNKLEKLKV